MLIANLGLYKIESQKGRPLDNAVLRWDGELDY